MKSPTKHQPRPVDPDSPKDEMDEAINAKLIGKYVTGFCCCMDHEHRDGTRGSQLEFGLENGVILEINIHYEKHGIEVVFVVPESPEVIQ